MAELITFRSFDTKEEAAMLCTLLYKNGIGAGIKKTYTTLANKIITGNSIPEEFHVQIDEDDLIKANNIIENSGSGTE